jgi:hypothetical protein
MDDAQAAPTSAFKSELLVCDGGRPVAIGYEDLIEFHDGDSPGGVAHAFKVLERALPALSPDEPAERGEIEIRTAFGGPGARDAFEFVTAAVSEGRYEVDPSLERPERGRANERFVFQLTYLGTTETLIVRDGFVSEEFIDLARTDDRSAEQESRLTEMKLEMAERVMAGPAAKVYDLID